MKSTRELEAPRQARSQGWGVRWVRKHSRHAKMVRPVEYRYLIISTRAGWHMIKFKIHALECTRTCHFYVKTFKNFLGTQTRPQREGDTRGPPTLALALTMKCSAVETHKNTNEILWSFVNCVNYYLRRR